MGSRQLLLIPPTALRYVAVSTSVVTQQQLSEPSPEARRARPCRVSSADRSVRKGISAHSLEDLLHKVWGRPTLYTAQPLGPWLRVGRESCLCPPGHELGVQQGWSSWLRWRKDFLSDASSNGWVEPAWSVVQLISEVCLVTGRGQYIAILYPHQVSGIFRAYFYFWKDP